MIPITNFENEYFLTKTGEVYRQGKFKPLKQILNSQSGYLQVDLWKNNKGVRKYIHRLLAEHFILNIDNKPEVNHKNSNRQDNTLNNLEWVTSSENSYHAYQAGYATQHQRRKLTEQDYKDIFSRFLTGESFSKIRKDYPIGAARLSINLRNLLIKWKSTKEYEIEKKRQQINRAHKNGAKHASN